MTTSMLSSRSAWVTTLPAVPHRPQGRLVDDVGQLRAGGAGGHAGDRAESPHPAQFCTFLAWTFRIASRPCKVGQLHRYPAVKPAGAQSAPGPGTPGRLVAARMMTPLLPSKPSISVSSWLRVCSRSSLPPMLPPSRFLPMASISSIKTMQGAFSLACLKRSRTLEAPMPTNISTNSEPDMEKKGTLASPATALASMVLPVPGGPTSRMPFGHARHRSPCTLRDRAGSRRSPARFSLASSSPATSENWMPSDGFDIDFGVALSHAEHHGVRAAGLVHHLLGHVLPEADEQNQRQAQGEQKVEPGGGLLDHFAPVGTPASSRRWVSSRSGIMPVW